MGIEDVDVIKTHPLQALVAGGDQVLAAAPFPIGTVPHVVARLGRDDEFIPMVAKIGAEDFAERFLGAARGRAVVVGQVEMGDPEVKGGAADCLFGRMGRVMAEVVPQPKADGRELQAALAAAVVDHPLVAVTAGGIGHGVLLLAAPFHAISAASSCAGPGSGGCWRP